jgi:hypothetical protein
MARRCWLAGLLTLLMLGRPARSHAAPFAPASPPFGMPELPLESMTLSARERIGSVLRDPTLSSKGPSETFNADPAMYRWLLEHPEAGVKLWRLLGARVADILERDGVYYWRDGQGSDLHWHIAYRGHGLHVWYAEGKVKPGLLLPTSAFRAVAVMRYTEGKDVTGKPAIRHQVHFSVHCDGRAVALAARLLGASAPRLAEQYLGQLQMFYGGMAWYLGQDSDRARKLFARIGIDLPEQAKR